MQKGEKLMCDRCGEWFEDQYAGIYLDGNGDLYQLVCEKCYEEEENGESSENEIQVPRDDGSIMEMTIQQYMLSEMLRAKLASAQQPTQPTTEEKPQL